MTQEEKAKAYDKALERARIWKNKSGMPKDRQGILDNIFPELKESEDEKIRKWLLDTITQIPNDSIEWDVIEKAKVLAWLEKQGEKKPTDKVEPKFKVGDWVVDNCNNVWQVVEVSNNFYRLKNINESESLPKIKWVNETFHLWSVKDAKDGDVLIDGDGHTFIFEKLSTNLYNHSYCYGGRDFFVASAGSHKVKNTHPATKQEIDDFFAKMKKAGYEWNAEKKELNKIAQKPAWSKEDEQNWYVEYVYILDYSTGRVIVTKHNIDESISELFEQLGLKENQCQYMVSDKILSIEYINF